ncbi:hypothetical protein CcCBS67573_g10184 [Chytriomyces confervae]|uniref:Uncharacterized protein n=1 Tax=Chytriomyces confervae TaxID=246404 RepID=A0A507DBN0_9FUNG|nr:hypothetical protein CcCBS67573_g10184 [Chytriomyces confervae]
MTATDVHVLQHVAFSASAPATTGPSALKAHSLLSTNKHSDALHLCIASFTGYPPGLRVDKCELLNVIHELIHTSTADLALGPQILQFLKSVQRTPAEHLYYRARAALLSFQLLFKEGNFSAGTTKLRYAIAFMESISLQELNDGVVDCEGRLVAMEEALNNPQFGMLTFARILLASMEGRA